MSSPQFLVGWQTGAPAARLRAIFSFCCCRWSKAALLADAVYSIAPRRRPIELYARTAGACVPVIAEFLCLAIKFGDRQTLGEREFSIDRGRHPIGWNSRTALYIFLSLRFFLNRYSEISTFG